MGVVHRRKRARHTGRNVGAERGGTTWSCVRRRFADAHCRCQEMVEATRGRDARYLVSPQRQSGKRYADLATDGEGQGAKRRDGGHGSTLSKRASGRWKPTPRWAAGRFLHITILRLSLRGNRSRKRPAGPGPGSGLRAPDRGTPTACESAARFRMGRSRRANSGAPRHDSSLRTCLGGGWGRRGPLAKEWLCSPAWLVNSRAGCPSPSSIAISAVPSRPR
jgi:hypothetical protein